MMMPWIPWVGFVFFVLLMMALDLRVLGRSKEGVSFKLALAWTGVCVLLALAFVPTIYFIYQNGYWGLGLSAPPRVGPDHKLGQVNGMAAAAFFLQGWLLEYSLSIDNIFVFAVIFRHFKVPPRHQHRVLAWGIIAALILRGIMIGLGAWLISQFHWMLYIAAVFLIYTAWGMVRGHTDFDPSKSWVLKVARRFFAVTTDFHGDRFFIKQATEAKPRPHLTATPMFLVLIVLNIVDILFALDSVPAVLGVTTDPFIVFTSNVFALLGLRSLYFVLAGMMHKFKYLNVSLAVILAFVGVKMLIAHPIHAIGFGGVHISPPMSLVVIVVALALGVVFSLRAKADTHDAPAPLDEPPAA